MKLFAESFLTKGQEEEQTHLQGQLLYLNGKRRGERSVCAGEKELLWKCQQLNKQTLDFFFPASSLKFN